MKTNGVSIIIAFIFFQFLFACDSNSTTSGSDAIYFGGDILTMEGEEATYAEAVVVDSGKIVFVGKKEEALQKKGQNTELIDLEGKTLLPGFIDAHGHVWNAGFHAVSANLMAPPDGEGKDVASLVKVTKEWKEKNKLAIQKSGWIIGFGYDDAQLAEKRHPVASELDKVSEDIPVLFIHQSGHLAVMNHKALEMAGYNAESKNPPGGVIRREEGSQEPNGVLEEMAFFMAIYKLFGQMDELSAQLIAKAGMKAYIKNGFTTAQEGRSNINTAETWRKMAEKNQLMMDVAVYPDLAAHPVYMKEQDVQKEYNNHYRIAGVKISLDGSPQGKTAWLTEPYAVPPEGQEDTYVGYPAFPNESQVLDLVKKAYENNWQLLAHCNGDAAIDQYIKALRIATDEFGNEDRRSVVIHAQTIREDQLDSLKLLGVIPSYFGSHTFYWGDWHKKEVLGEERAARISPAKSTLNRGMIYTQHHDAPVTLPNPLMILYAQVNRKTRSGSIIGEVQKVSIYDALRSITIWAAHQYFEENLKGSLKEGKLADFVILDQNPMKINPEELLNIQILQTIKEGKIIFEKKGKAS